MINSLLSTSAIHNTFLTVGIVNKSCCSLSLFLITPSVLQLSKCCEVVDRLAINFAIAAFPKPAPGSLVSSENLTKLGTRMAVGTRLQTNEMAGWF